MHIIEPYQLRQRSLHKRRNKILRFVVFLVATVLLCGTGTGVWASTRPLPQISGNAVYEQPISKKVPIDWPKKGQAAIGAQGYGVLETTRIQAPLPTASVAKVMVALCVLHKYPIEVGHSGETLTLTKNDVAIYNKELARNGSVVRVKAGEKISEYDALQALLLPSANNMAATLAIWAFGSEQQYLDYANNLAKTMGMIQTHFSDASGFSPKTVSSAEDLIVLGQTAMKQPVIAEIVAKDSAILPVAGQVKNVNSLVGKNGIIGIKTGNTDEAGGVYLFAANHTFANQKPILITGAVMKASDLKAAINSSLPMLNSAYKGFGETTLLRKGTVVGHYDIPWSGRVNVVADQDLKAFGWLGSNPELEITLNELNAPVNDGVIVGKASSGSRSVNLILENPVFRPAVSWRLSHTIKR
jgi:serine-type D-Ala-D-Ala carboxypeptidase (penicillin-binding protein 5/6)